MNSVLQQHIEDVTISDINRSLNDYLNGENDARWYCFIPPFLPRLKYPLFKYGNSSLTPADLYESALETYKNTPKRIEVVDNIRTYQDWLKEAQKRPDVEYLRAIFELKEYVNKNFTKDELVGFYIYGSVVDFSYVYSWSDLDTLVILKKQVLKDLGWLRDLKRRLVASTVFCRLWDPLGLRRHFIITEYDMQTCADMLFYRIVFCWLELASFSDKIRFSLVDIKDPKREVQRMSKKKLQDLKNYCLMLKDKGSLNFFEAKAAVLVIRSALTWLAEYSGGEYIYCNFTKTKTILNDFADFSKKHQSLINKALLTRQCCPFYSHYPYCLRRGIGLAFDSRLLHFIHHHIDCSKAQQIYQIMGVSFIDDVIDLIKEIEHRLEL